MGASLAAIIFACSRRSRSCRRSPPSLRLLQRGLHRVSRRHGSCPTAATCGSIPVAACERDPAVVVVAAAAAAAAPLAAAAAPVAAAAAPLAAAAAPVAAAGRGLDGSGLQDAVARIPSFARVEIRLLGGTYLMDASICVHGVHLVLIGDEDDDVVLDGQHETRLFDVAHGGKLELIRVDIRNGAGVHSGAAIQVRRGDRVNPQLPPSRTAGNWRLASRPGGRRDP